MAFEMRVESHAPLTNETDPERLAKLVFQKIGYTARKGPDHGISFRLFYQCFLLHPHRAWTVEELATSAGTTMPSVYRHLNKLMELDLIEDLHLDEGPNDGRRAFRLRYGDLSKAWNFVEAHFQLAMENYRQSIDHLENLLREARQGAGEPEPASRKEAPADGAAELVEGDHADDAAEGDDAGGEETASQTQLSA